MVYKQLKSTYEFLSTFTLYIVSFVSVITDCIFQHEPHF